MLAMSTVGAVMVGRLGQGPLAALALGQTAASFAILTGIAALSPLRAQVARGLGAGESVAQQGHRFWSGIGVACALSLPIAFVLTFSEQLVGLIGRFRSEPGAAFSPELLANAALFCRALAPGVPMMIGYSACLFFLQGFGKVRAVLIITAVGNAVNLAACWLLVFGHAGLPKLGAAGAAWATTATRALMLGALVGYMLARPDVRPAMESRQLASGLRQSAGLLWLGLPLAVKMALEYGVYVVLALGMAKFSAAAIAGNQILVNLSALISMVPVGIGSGVCVRVAHHLGRADNGAALRSAQLGLRYAFGFALILGVSIWLFPGAWTALFTPDADVALTLTAMSAPGAFYIALNGVSLLANYALEGALDTRVPTVVTFLASWLLCIPLALVLGFEMGLGAFGLWMGFAIGKGLGAGYLFMRARRILQLSNKPADLGLVTDQQRAR